MPEFVVGQRWISAMEPELGLGEVIAVGPQTIHIRFSASECHREYAIASAPLRRVRFRPGDEIIITSAGRHIVSAVEEINGLLVYHCPDGSFPETELSDTFSFTTPKNRFFKGLVDSNSAFNLRYETNLHLHTYRSNPVRGFVGARVQLIPHQLYIAAQVVSRYRPRVLLADEVGLGKTIEACLILHRLLLTNRIARVLILVPQSLVHQWFVELLRKFNLFFRIFDEDYCRSLEAGGADFNPFLEHQLAICDLEFLTTLPKRRDQALAAGWDLLVVDEAHHLTEASLAYNLVTALAGNTPGILLLTATPEQLGARDHFQRLHLLDPPRYPNFNRFLQDNKIYHKVARMVNRLLDAHPLSEEDLAELLELQPKKRKADPRRLREKLNHDPLYREKLLNEILDQQGTGRVMFRNSRRTISGFPERMVHLVPLPASPREVQRLHRNLRSELRTGKSRHDSLEEVKIDWLAVLLHKHKKEKFLLICHTPQKAIHLHEKLQQKIKLAVALFHEGMTLIQRDRNAAWFAEKEGARLLICSEIGSEGRNFQFVHHLILFDLPPDPELLEQRIGRLDRIGQTRTIHIHVPFLSESAEEILVRWFHEGLKCFEKNVPGLYPIFQKFAPEIRELLIQTCHSGEIPTTPLNDLLHTTRLFQKKVARRLEKGRDRLLELVSYRAPEAAHLIRQIKEQDHSFKLQNFMLKVFNYFGVACEDWEERCFRLHFNTLKDDSFPVPILREQGLMVTFARKKAIQREDYEFLTWDHPMVTGAMELILGSEQGNSCFARWPDNHTRAVYLEAVYILEGVAPLSLQIDRFLPPTPIRVLIDHQLQERSRQILPRQLEKTLQDASPDSFLDHPRFSQKLVPEMLKKSHELAEVQKNTLILSALERMQETVGSEIQRLKNLQPVNPEIRPEEITLWENERDRLQQHLSRARLRLDAIRVIWRG